MFFVINILYCFGLLKRELKILQLNEYSTIKFIKYKLKPYKCDIFIYLISICVLIIWLLVNEMVGEYLIFLLTVIYVIYYLFFIIKNIKNNICPKYTKRVLRIFIIYVLLSIMCVFMAPTFNTITITYIIMPIIFEFLTIASNILIVFFELILCSFYAKNASKKIEKLEIKKIAITGSYGKTSVKNILTTILEEKYCVLSSPKSYNTVNGFSLTIRNNNISKYDVIIMEMGAKKKGDIKKLCKLFKPQYGILTAIEKQHLETFKNIESIIDTKKELQDNLTDDSVMVFNCNNLYVRNLCNEFKGCSVSVGSIKDGVFDFCANVINVSIEGCLFDIYKKGEFFCKAKCELIGYHNIENILLAVAMADELGLSKKQIVSGISKLTPIESRMQPIEISNSNIIINNGYNSNPSSVKASLNLIRLYNKTKVAIVCGFVEMGNEQYELNKMLGSQIAESADIVYVVNKVNRKAILDGLAEGGFKGQLNIVDKFRDIDFTVFNDSVILIENDLPDNYE